MAKRSKCATCDADLTGKDYDLVWDEVNQKTVKVCCKRSCAAPFTLKGGKLGDYKATAANNGLRSA